MIGSATLAAIALFSGSLDPLIEGFASPSAKLPVTVLCLKTEVDQFGFIIGCDVTHASDEINIPGMFRRDGVFIIEPNLAVTSEHKLCADLALADNNAVSEQHWRERSNATALRICNFRHSETSSLLNEHSDVMASREIQHRLREWLYWKHVPKKFTGAIEENGFDRMDQGRRLAVVGESKTGDQLLYARARLRCDTSQIFKIGPRPIQREESGICGGFSRVSGFGGGFGSTPHFVGGQLSEEGAGTGGQESPKQQDGLHGNGTPAGGGDDEPHFSVPSASRRFGEIGLLYAMILGGLAASVSFVHTVQAASNGRKVLWAAAFSTCAVVSALSGQCLIMWDAWGLWR